MRCAFYCTAEYYELEAFFAFLEKNKHAPDLYDKVIHVEKNKNKNSLFEEKHIFYFSYGCVVFWGFSKKEEKILLKGLMGYEINKLPYVAQDVCNYLYKHLAEKDKIVIREEEDEITLDSDDIFIKLSLSYGLSQSVKLATFERSVDATIEKTRYLPEELKIRGRTTLPKKELAQMIGALFAERTSINLHSDILDTPEFFWRRPRYEIYYQNASHYMDITTRLDILNRRLEVIHDLYQILSTELHHLHSTRLEVIIVVLITIEVVLSLLRDFIL